MSAHDFNSNCHNRLLGTTESTQGRLTNVFGTGCVRASHGVFAAARVQLVRTAVWWESASAGLHLSRSIPVSGVCPTDFSRKPPRHRDMSAGCGTEVVSRWL